jgi:hypothetical protein
LFGKVAGDKVEGTIGQGLIFSNRNLTQAEMNALTKALKQVEPKFIHKPKLSGPLQEELAKWWAKLGYK